MQWKKIVGRSLATVVGIAALGLAIKGCRSVNETLSLYPRQQDQFYKELFVSYEYATPGGSSVSPCGLADQNENGTIEFAEQATAWKRMGYWDRAYFETGSVDFFPARFPTPSTAELKQARDWYRQHLGRDFPRLYPEEFK